MSIAASVAAAPIKMASVKDPGLSEAWGQAKAVINGTVGSGFLNVLAGIGIVIILFAVIKFFWDKRRGNGANSKAMWFLVACGAVLAAPTILMGFFLEIVDWALMGVQQVFNFFSGKVKFK